MNKSEFELLADKIPFSGCWIWTRPLMPNGYGKLKVSGTTWRAHRYAYELFVGPIPNELLVLHTCDIKCCVNPKHLKLGTHADNTGDILVQATSPNWGRVKGDKCKSGHPLIEGNLYTNPKGYTQCKLCCNPKNRVLAK